MERLAHVLEEADWRWLPLAFVSESLFQCNEATIYWMMYRTMGFRPGIGSAIQLTLAAGFVNRVAPSAGVSGTTLFAERMSRRGIPVGATVSVNVARYVLDYGAFLIVLGAGLLYLSSHHELTPIEVRAALIFGIAVLAIVAAAAALIARRRVLARLLSASWRMAGRLARRIFRRELALEAKVTHSLDEFFAALGLLRQSAALTAALIPMAFFIHLFDLASLYIVFIALAQPIHVGVLIAGYGLAYLMGFVSLVPSGLGVFEASMTVVYASLGVPLESAILVTLVYRLFSLWVPLLAGYVALHLALGREDRHGPLA